MSDELVNTDTVYSFTAKTDTNVTAKFILLEEETSDEDVSVDVNLDGTIDENDANELLKIVLNRDYKPEKWSSDTDPMKFDIDGDKTLTATDCVKILEVIQG